MKLLQEILRKISCILTFLYFLLYRLICVFAICEEFSCHTNPLLYERKILVFWCIIFERITCKLSEICMPCHQNQKINYLDKKYSCTIFRKTDYHYFFLYVFCERRKKKKFLDLKNGHMWTTHESFLNKIFRSN